MTSIKRDALTIRPLTAADEVEWRRLWTSYLEFYETTLPEAIYETAWARLLKECDREFQGVVAELDGRLVGLAHYLFHRTLWSTKDTCYLMDLFADPLVRGQGVGGALIEAVRQRALLAGIPSLYWMTQEFNYTGRILYDKVAEKTPFIVYEINS
ncbi:GNAT family N-acetyltransferase [Ruegeria lacuscaerulensis]|uniref:GNAT family N-acetyltransferase n=1 Tax=Ruegeria lacuscaerulensis TaxID=55218 RepID=UPI00147D491C|nr:GNAT family N-acetyltransferase [Ruegeria lacuscaerulensis]